MFTINAVKVTEHSKGALKSISTPSIGLKNQPDLIFQRYRLKEDKVFVKTVATPSRYFQLVEHKIMMNEDRQMNAILAIKHYQQVSVNSSVMGASPHQLVQMLMEGALERISLAKASMARNDIAMKGKNISSAIGIVGGLQESLNIKAGGKIAEDLNNLYGYMTGRLLAANSQNDEGILDEVSGLMMEIKMGWETMPASYKH